MSRLHLREKDLWRYPLTRALLHPLLKGGMQTVEYNRDAKIWKLNGATLQIHNKKTYSKIAGIILYVFHKIRLCLSPDYRNKFNAAKLKIKNARIEAKKNHQLAHWWSIYEDAWKSGDPITQKSAVSEIKKLRSDDWVNEKVKRLRHQRFQLKNRSNIPRFDITTDNKKDEYDK